MSNSQASGRPASSYLLGELLISRGLIGEEDLRKALAFQERFGGRLGAVLIRLGALSEDSLLPVLAAQLGMPMLEPAGIPTEDQGTEALLTEAGISRDWLLDQDAILWQDTEGGLHCVARDPLDPALTEVLAEALPGRELQWHLARNQDLDAALETIRRFSRALTHRDGDDISHLRELAEEAPIIETVNNLLSQAADQGASDIHVEPEEREFFVRFRIDGVLHTKLVMPRERFPAVASRIKLISGMDIAERRLPQDGRLSARVSGREIDVRVSSAPCVHGESIVMRLLPKEEKQMRLDRLGLEPDHYRQFRAWAEEPHGIILVTGPTGSGKSTTLYSTLEEVNDRELKIITVEDPVEYQLRGVTQIQARSDIGYSFANALRAILRQDPDVIMIGEIRDLETAEIAVQAALTGHLVFSTLHTNDSVSAFTRLIDMGVEPFLVATSVRAVQAQRLVRRICERCCQPATPLAEVAALAESVLPKGEAVEPAQWRVAVGCAHCQGTGYRGRLGIYEMVGVSTELQQLILRRATGGEMREQARRQGARTLREDGLLKARRGLTSVEEVIRVTGGLQDVEA